MHPVDDKVGWCKSDCLQHTII